MSEQEVRGLCMAAGLQVSKLWKLVNGYWPDTENYRELREQNPWWLINTQVGLIEIGRRKRVWVIDWSQTSIRKCITDDETTKDETMVHAWKIEDVLTYLIELRKTHEAR